ncbi:hypothetical protein [Bacillus sp. BP-3]|uniref:hypothetical protein n=1 Tax=Bacillus sp. BP-3 TaxID=3022773 RepID=UPI00232F464F|nr:hypothetical protein [Bacillus sp. BP-3]MDC2864096.1 hypothetical protein [Bacillus sp. BP-3]
MFSSLPGWFWAIYYVFLLIAFSLSCVYLSQKKKQRISIIGSIINICCIAREGNEWDHFKLSFSQGESWTFFTLGGHIYILLWTLLLIWLLFHLFKRKRIESTMKE